MPSAPSLLIIDDNTRLLHAYADFFTRAGFRVHTSDSAETGIALAQSESPTLILLDLMMPKKNGLSFFGNEAMRE